jgi:hypothetical protein
MFHEGNGRAALISAAPDLWIGRIPRAVELDGPGASRLPDQPPNDSPTRALACKLTASNSLEVEVRWDPELASRKDDKHEKNVSSVVEYFA